MLELRVELLSLLLFPFFSSFFLILGLARRDHQDAGLLQFPEVQVQPHTVLKETKDLLHGALPDAEGDGALHVERLVGCHVLHAGLLGDGLDDVAHCRPLDGERDPRLQYRLPGSLILLGARLPVRQQTGGDPSQRHRRKRARDSHHPHGRPPQASLLCQPRYAIA